MSVIFGSSWKSHQGDNRMTGGCTLFLVFLHVVVTSWEGEMLSAEASEVYTGAPTRRPAVYIDDQKEMPSAAANVDEIIQRIKRKADELMTQKLERTKEIYKLAETPSHRTRRSIPDQLTKAYDAFYELTSTQATDIISIPNCIAIESFSVFNIHYIVAASVNLTHEVTFVYRYHNGTSTELQVLETAGVKDLAVFQQEDTTILIIMESNSNTAGLPTGTAVYQFRNATGKFRYIQRVVTDNPTKVEVFSSEGQEYVIFVGANVETVDEDFQRRVSAIYRWEGGHLDKVSTFVTGDAVDVHPFPVHSLVFLGLANHTDSHILLFNPHLEEFARYQDIDITDAVDWESFYLGEGRHRDYFLAVASGKDGSGQSVIYKYYRNEFVPFQSFSTTGARQWHAVRNTDGSLRILVLSSNDGISFFEYNGWRFEESPSSISSAVESEVLGFTSFISNGHVVLLVADNSTLEGSMFDLSFTASVPVQQLHRNAALTCLSLRAEIASLEDGLSPALDASSNLVYVNSSEVQVITGNKTFTQNVTMEIAVANEIHAADGMILDTEEQMEFSEVKSNQTKSFTDLDTIEEELEGAVRRTGPQQTIRGQKMFIAMTASILEADSVSVDGDVINQNVNVSELVYETWHKDQDQNVDVGFSIAGNVTVLEDLTVSETLDGLDTSAIVTLYGNHTIEGSKHFQSPVNFRGNLEVEESIDGIKINETSLLLTYGNQTIQSHLNVSGLVTFLDNVEVDGLVDGCNLSALGQDAVLTVGNFTVTGNKNFTGDLTPQVGVTMGPGHTLDGVDVLQLNQTVMKITGYQELTGNYSFTQTVEISGNLTVGGLVDGLSIPNDILVENSPTEAVLEENWIFSDDVTVENITVLTTIDGINATGGGTGLALLLTNGVSQTLEGAITFAGGLCLEGSSQVAGLVDGVNITTIIADAVYKDQNQQITGTKIFLSDVNFQQNLQVDGFINGINLTDYASRALKLSEDDVLVLEGDIELTAPTVRMAGPLTTGGNHSFSNNRTVHDLVIQGERDIIYGLKSFPGVASSDDVEATTVNGINISHFFKDAVRTIPGEVLTIDENVTFWDDVEMNENLDVKSQIIDDVYIPDIATLSNDSTVKQTTTFTRVQTAVNLHVHTLTMSGLLNGYDVQELDRNTLKTNAMGIKYKLQTQNVTGKKTFLNGLFIGGDLVVMGNTNGIDLSLVADDAVYVHHAYTQITAGKVFDGLVNVTHLNALDHIDGVHLPSFSEQVVVQMIPQTIEGAVQFTQDLHFDDNVTVTKAINGYSISTDLLRILKITDCSFSGNLEFSNIISGGKVIVNGLIDGFKVEDFVLKNSAFQAISGEKRFTGSLISEESMIALLINGISIDDLNALAVRYNKTEDIDGNKTFASGISLRQNLTVTTLVDTVNVQQLGGTLLRSTDGRNLVFHGNVTLGNILVRGNVSYNITLDGVDLKSLERTYISLTLPQTVTGTKTFQDPMKIAAPGTLTAGSVQLGGDLNRVDLEEFTESVWVSGRWDEVAGVKTFTKNSTLGSLTVNGTINGLSVADNAMITNQSNTVTGIKTFTGSPLTVEGMINMKHLKEVDGVDLSEFKKNAVTVSGDYNILLPTAMASMILQSNLIVEGEIDGVDVSNKGLLLTIGTQEITGGKTFTSDVTVASNIIVNGLLNGVDLVDLFQNTLLLSPNQTVNGNYTFFAESVFGNVTTMANVDNVRIPELYRLVYTYPNLTALNESLHLKCDMLNQMREVQKYAAVLMSHLVITQIIDTVGYNSWHAFYYNETQWLVLAQRTTYPPTQCISSEIYQWNDTTQQYEYYQSLYPKSAVDVDSFVMNGRLFLAVAGKHNDTGQCQNFPVLNEGDDVDGIITQNRTVIPSRFYSYSTTNVLVWLPDKEAFYLYQALPCVSPSDVEVFVDPLSNQTCIAIANEVHIDNNIDFISVLPSYVFCLESLESGFYLKDTFVTAGASKIKHFIRDGILHLAVANRLDSSKRSFTANSAVFQQISNGSFIQLATAESNAASDILPVTIEGNWYIILSNEFIGTLNRANYGAPVGIYRLTDANTLVHEQDIQAYGSMSLGYFRTEDQFFLVIVDQLATTVHQYLGIDLFKKVHTLTTPGATSVHVFPLGDTGRWQMALAAYAEEDLFVEDLFIHALPAPAMILEFVLNGERLETVPCSCDD